MTHKVSLELISPVHIGSGKMIQGNAEYLHFVQENSLAIVDETKILDLIGIDQLPIWMEYIENPSASFIDYLKQRKGDIRATHIAKRILQLEGNKSPIPANTLREQIHTGRGMPYIPGSSIKGALKTVFFADSMLQRYKKSGIDTDRLKHPKKRHQYKDVQLATQTFGKDPNHDWFRLIQVSDFHFSVGTAASFSETLNETGNEQAYELKNSVKQLVEFLPEGSISLEGSIKFNTILQERANQKRLFNQNGSTLTLATFIEKINAHTLRLIERELKFFQTSDMPEEGDLFLERLREIKALIADLSSKECLLRMGFGTGFRSMTGDWLEVLNDDQYYDLSDAIRGKKYYNYPLPKSRKIILGGQPFGFVKIKFL